MQDSEDKSEDELSEEDIVYEAEDADGVKQTPVSDWGETELRTTGVNETLDADGLTTSLETFQPTKSSNIEIIVDGEVVHRLIGVSDDG